MNKIFRNIYIKVILLFFTLIVTYLCYLSYAQTCYVSIQYTTDISFFLKDHLFFNIIITILFVLLIFLLSKSKHARNFINKINCDDNLYKIVKIILLIIIGLIGFIWVYATQIYPQGDQYIVTNAVERFRVGEYGLFDSGDYMEMFPNQNGLFIIYYLLSFVSGDNFYLFVQVFNVLSVVLIYKALSDIVKINGSSNFASILVIISALLFPVLLIYTWLIYGNIPGMAFGILAIKYELLFFKEYKLKLGLLSTIFISLSLMLKSFSLIYLVAMIIYAIFKTIDKKCINGLIIVGLFIVGFILQSALPRAFIESRINHKLDQGSSYYAHIAMGMQEGDRAPGWHNKYNVNSYHESGNVSEVQKEMAITSIQGRLKEFKNNPEDCLRFYNMKTASQWNNPTFEIFYGMDEDFGYGFQYRFTKYDSMTNFFEKCLNLHVQNKFQSILNVEQSLMLFGVMLYLLLKKEKSMEELLLPMILVGGFLFLLIWEAKSQYALYFYIVLMLYGVLGYVELYKYFLNPYKVKAFQVTIYVLVTMFIFSLIFKPYLTADNKRYGQYLACGNTYDWFN